MASAKTQKIALPKRSNPVALYLMVLAALICLYSGYEQFAVPRLEGPQKTITKVESDLENDSAPLLQDKSRIIAMLGDESDHWELQPCSTLKLDEGLVLFKTRKNCDDGSVQFSPFTFVSGETTAGDGASSTQRPFIVRSTEGANIKFNKRFNGMNFDGIKPVLCKLQGEVEIYSLSDQTKDESLIYIATRDLTIDAHKITTPESVEFKFGESLGIGSGLSIELAHPSSALADFSNITGIHRLQLEKIDKIRLEPESKNTSAPSNAFQTTSTLTPQSKNQMESKDGPIEVTCNGSFQFNFETGYAEFFDSVTANQLVQQNKIECDHLLLMFGAPSKTQSTPLKSAYSKTKISELSRLVANGAPATITTPSASIKANTLTFDPETNLFSGQKYQTSAGLPVQIQSDEMQLEADLLRYRANQDGSLGDLQIVGPGWIKFAGKTTKDAISASWQKNLRTLPNPQNSDIFELVLSGQSVISTDAQTSINAEQISLQIRKTYNQNIRERTSGSSTFKNSTTASAKPNYVPVQLSTMGTTNLRSPEIEGQTEELVAIWLKAPTVNNARVAKRAPTTPRPAKQFSPQNNPQSRYIKPASSTTQSTSLPNTQPLPATALDSTQPLLQRNLQSSNTTGNRSPQTSRTFISKPRSDLNLRSTTSPKLKFGGRKLTLLLKSDQSQTEVKKMLIQGGVTIKRGRKPIHANHVITQQQNSAFEIKNSSQVELEKIDNSDFHLLTIVSDQPQGAELALGELSVSGKRIAINEKLNQLVIRGIGTLHLNSSEQTQAKPVKFNSTGMLSQQQDSTQLNVQWNEGMIFDGSTIYFQKEVHSKTLQQSPDGAMATLDSHSDALFVELDKRFSFHNPQSSSPKIRKFEFRDHIPNSDRAFKNNLTLLPDPVHPEPVKILRQNFNPKREQSQKILAHMGRATVNVESGVTQLTGPGKIAIHRLNTGNVGLPMLTFEPQQKPNPGPLNFIQIDFEGGMKIDSESDRLNTNSGAKIFYDIVSNWLPPNQANLNSGSVTLECDELEIDKWAPRNQKQNVELLATGNVTFTSDALDITADRIAYNGSTDKITIKGNIRNDANLVHRKFLGDLKPDRLNARSFSYSVKDKALSADGMRQLNIK
ncbi:hypothetical protein N9006_01225 [bacterium]|nr:hypothetical protein [bacterium]